MTLDPDPLFIVPYPLVLFLSRNLGWGSCCCCCSCHSCCSFDRGKTKSTPSPRLKTWSLTIYRNFFQFHMIYIRKVDCRLGVLILRTDSKINKVCLRVTVCSHQMKSSYIIQSCATSHIFLRTKGNSSLVEAPQFQKA